MTNEDRWWAAARAELGLNEDVSRETVWRTLNEKRRRDAARAAKAVAALLEAELEMQVLMRRLRGKR